MALSKELQDLVNQVGSTKPAAQQLSEVFNKYGQYTSGFSTPYTGYSTADQAFNVKQTYQQQNLFQKIGAIASQSFDVGKFLLSRGAGFIKNSAISAGRDAYGFGKSVVEAQSQPLINHAIQESSRQLDMKLEQIQNDYKSGKMTKDDYRKALLDYSAAQQGLSKESQKISQGPSPQERAMQLVNTAVNIMSLGGLGLAEVGAKQVLAAGGKAEIKNLIADGATSLEKLALKVPAVQSLVERNLTSEATQLAQKLEGESVLQYLKREGKNVATDLLIKRPIFYQSNIGGAQDVYNKIMHDKDYKGAVWSSVWLASQMIDGGPLGVFSKGYSWIKKGTRELTYGSGSFLDELGKRTNTDFVGWLTRLKKEDPKAFAEAEKTWRIAQEINLQVNKDNVQGAVDDFLRPYLSTGEDITRVTEEELTKRMTNWAKADAIAKKIDKNLVAVRLDSPTKNALAEAVAGGGDKPEQSLYIIQRMGEQPGVGWGNNELFMRRLGQIVEDNPTAAARASAIRKIQTATLAYDGLDAKVAKELEKLGYTLATPAKGRVTPSVEYEDTRKLISAAVRGESDIFDPATAPAPFFGTIGRWLSKAGVSPEAASTAANQSLRQSIVAELDKVGLSKNISLKSYETGEKTRGGAAILSKLQTYVENKRGVFGLGKSAMTDIRQMAPHEIQDALKSRNFRLDTAQAQELSHAIMDGYLKVPLEMRGAGDKIIDYLYAVNPLQKYYSRIQSALRYTYNPFFRAQERVETKLLSHAQASNLLWNKTRAELNQSVKVLEEARFFSSSLPGEAAQDQLLGRLTANITQGQKRDLAGLAEDLAAQRGITLKELVTDHGDEVNDLLRVVVQDPQKGVLASPLARTMNLLFFPMRYNVKVTQIAAQVLAKQPPSVQLAVLHSGFKMRDWMKSDEGIAWQAEHADAIALLNWITPINSIEYTLNLLGHKPESMADLGQLGGLPLGFISQILDSQGWLNINKPYVQPKTGELFPTNTPESLKARASVALVDLLGTMFTYPGRTLGLPGKEASIKKFVADFIATNGSDFDQKYEYDKLTPLQKNWIRVLKGDTSKEAVDALYNSPAPANDAIKIPFQWYTIPPLNLPEIKQPRGPKVKNKATPISGAF